MKIERLTKAVKVSDPNNWYEETAITVSMFSLPTEPDTIRVIFKSIDDFLVYQDFSEWGKQANWDCMNGCGKISQILLVVIGCTGTGIDLFKEK